MKNIIVKVVLLQEKTYEISIDENIITKETIMNYANNPKFADYIYETDNNPSDLKKSPRELNPFDDCFEQMGMNSENNLYLNLAKMVAYTKAKYNSDVIKGLSPIDNLSSDEKSKATGISISYRGDDHSEIRYDFECNESSMIKSPDTE